MKEKVKLHFAKVKPFKALSGVDRSSTPLSESLAGVTSSGRSEVTRLVHFTQVEACLLLPGSTETADIGLCVNTDSEVSRWSLLIREPYKLKQRPKPFYRNYANAILPYGVSASFWNLAGSLGNFGNSTDFTGTYFSQYTT